LEKHIKHKLKKEKIRKTMLQSLKKIKNTKEKIRKKNLLFEFFLLEHFVQKNNMVMLKHIL
jgi:hypothetical protein